MTTVNQSIVWSANSAAEYTNAVKALSQAFDAIGLQKSTDTGQVDLTVAALTLPAPAQYTTTYNYYEIRMLTAVGLPTLYLRVNYGVTNPSSGATDQRPVMSVQVGTQTDGAGNLGGVVNPWPMMTLGMDSPSQSYTTIYAASTSLVLRPLNFASDGANYLTVMIDPTVQVNDTNNHAVAAFTIERTITPGDGTYNDHGWVQYDAGGNYTAGVYGPNSGYSVTSIVSAFTVHTNTGVPAQTPGALYTSSGAGNSASIFPLTVMTPVPEGPMSAAVVYFSNDIIGGLQFQATMYGQLRTYFALGQKPINAINCNPANSANYSPALRYD